MTTEWIAVVFVIVAVGVTITVAVVSGFRRMADRIDELDRRLCDRIDAFEQRLGARIDTLGQRLSERISGVERRLGRIDRCRSAMAAASGRLGRGRGDERSITAGSRASWR